MYIFFDLVDLELTYFTVVPFLTDYDHQGAYLCAISLKKV